MRIGFAGSGNMAAALARGWARCDDGPESMAFADSGSGRARALASELGGRPAGSLAELIADSDLIVLAVKPAALDSVADELDGGPPVLSVLGATSLERLRRSFQQPVERAMPNLGVEVGCGVVCHAPFSPGFGDAGPETLRLLGLLGLVIELPEDQLDPATAVMGCAPAYLAQVAAVLEREGRSRGLDPTTLRGMIAETLIGTGQLLHRHDPEAISAAVASPGGSTEAGLDALRDHDAAGAFAAAVGASLERMQQ